MRPAPTILAELENHLTKGGVTITQFSQLSGIHTGTLSNIIQGRRPISMQQLDRITMAMGQEAGFYYDLYIDHYILDGSPDWRRVKPLLKRCAELDKPGCIQRVIQILMDNLSYLSLLFDMAEELLDQGLVEAAAVLYECVAEGEKYQHSERLALCQYRLFTINLGDSYAANMQAANQFEPYVERLDETDQLDALKKLADVFIALQQLERADELAERLGEKAEAQYKVWEKEGLHKQPERPIIYYRLYAHLLRTVTCDERGDYEKALFYTSLYSDTSWITGPVNEAEQRVIEQFEEWAEANTYLFQLMAGKVEVLPDYVQYVESRENEIFPALLKILQAANRYKLNVDDILLRFQGYFSHREQISRLGGFTPQVTAVRYTHLLGELETYYSGKESSNAAFDYLLEGLRLSLEFINEANAIKGVGLLDHGVGV